MLNSFPPLFLLYAFLPSIAAGALQTATGFGAGIVLMLAFPCFLPLLKATALSSLICLALSVSIAVQMRKTVRWKSIIIPLICYLSVSTAAIPLSKLLPARGMKAWFGLFLVAVSLYFVFFEKNIHLRATPQSGIVCGGLAGLSGGFYGIGGPPMVPYFLAVAGEDKFLYLAITQAFFTVTNIYTSSVRIFNGILTFDLVYLAVPGVVGVILGRQVGYAIIRRINIEQMKKMIYLFLALSGVVTFVTNL